MFRSLTRWLRGQNGNFHERQAFGELNRQLWASIWSGRPRSDEAVFVLVEDSLIAQVCNGSFASIAAYDHGDDLLFVINSSHKGTIRFLESYPRARFLFTNRWRHPLILLGAIAAGLWTYKGLRSPKELLDLKMDDMWIGGIIYDNILARGFATLDRVDSRTLRSLIAFFYCKGIIKQALKRYRIRSSVFTHTIGLRGSTFSRYLLRANVPVINRLGTSELQVRKLGSLSDVGKYPLTPDRRYFDLMRDRDDGSIEAQADDYMRKRFSRQVTNTVASVTFDPSKRLFKSKADFCDTYDLTNDKPIAFVMLHAFNDYPHSHFARRMVFQDYYDWFANALAMAREIHTVNWIFKDHPARDHYVTKDCDLDQIFEDVDEDHIRYLDVNADFNASSIANIASVLLTCVGTAGLEYGTVGIPTILGGESAYSGFGFTIEPEDEISYRRCLEEIPSTPKLTPEQTRTAKLLAYFYFCAIARSPYHFCPELKDFNKMMWNVHVERAFLEKGIEDYQNPDKIALMRDQVGAVAKFLGDDSQTQTVDFSSTPLGDE